MIKNPLTDPTPEQKNPRANTIRNTHTRMGAAHERKYPHTMGSAHKQIPTDKTKFPIKKPTLETLVSSMEQIIKNSNWP